MWYAVHSKKKVKCLLCVGSMHKDEKNQLLNMKITPKQKKIDNLCTSSHRAYGLVRKIGKCPSRSWKKDGKIDV